MEPALVRGAPSQPASRSTLLPGHGTRALWVSVSKDLNFDAQRDLDDVRAETQVFPQVRARLSIDFLPCLSLPMPALPIS